MLTLAVDTSSPLGSVALVSGDPHNQSLLALKAWRRTKSHSEFITTAVEDCLKSTDIHLNQVDVFSVGQGPGSFTGIRVGINLVRSLAYAQSRPVYVANSLRILAEPALGLGHPVLCLVNAFKNMLYCAAYEENSEGVRELIPPQAMTVEQLEKRVDQTFVCVGDGFKIFQKHFSTNFCHKLHLFERIPASPSAHWLGVLALQDQGPKAQCTWEHVNPLYIRASEAEEKLRGGLLKPLPKLF